MSKLSTSLAWTALALAGGPFLTTHCGGSGSGGGGGGNPVPDAARPQAELVVNVVFPSASDESETSSVHVWAVAPRGESGMPSCTSLVGGSLDPYDQVLERRADVAVTPGALPASATGVGLGSALAYVEAVGFDGVTTLAGCEPVEIAEPKTETTVTLKKAGVFDCTDPETESGAACDDGKECTIGEKCSGGTCKGGTVRDCSYLADACNAATCNETLGCVANPLPDKTPCDDGAYCTEGDVCTAGICVGQVRDCSKEVVGQCKVVTGCSETSQSCMFSNAPSGTLCDDGKFCTINDTCSSFGSCSSSTPRDCSSVADQCNFAGCDEVADVCKGTPKSTSTSCNDGLACTLSDHCNGIGQCAPGTQKDCSSVADQCNLGTCTEPLGTCVKAPKTNGTPCNDNNPATLTDTCQNGNCVGT